MDSELISLCFIRIILLKGFNEFKTILENLSNKKQRDATLLFVLMSSKIRIRGFEIYLNEFCRRRKLKS